MPGHNQVSGRRRFPPSRRAAGELTGGIINVSCFSFQVEVVVVTAGYGGTPFQEVRPFLSFSRRGWPATAAARLGLRVRKMNSLVFNQQRGPHG